MTKAVAAGAMGEGADEAAEVKDEESELTVGTRGGFGAPWTIRSG